MRRSPPAVCRPRCLLVAAALASAVAGCGGVASPALRPAAEPANAPPVTRRPAGHLIGVGGMPEGIVVDPGARTIAVGLRDPPALLLLDAGSERARRRIMLAGAPRHLQLARPGGPVLVPEEGANVLAEVELPFGRVTPTRVRTQPHDATEASGRVFVGNEFGRSLSVIAGGRVRASIAGLYQPGGVAGVGSAVAVIDVQSELLSLYEARSLRLTGRIPSGAGPTHVVSDGADRLYVVDTRGDSLLTFALAPLRLLSRVSVAGSPYGIAIDPRRRRLWVTLTARNRLVEFELGGLAPRVLTTYATARQPNSVAVDAHTGRVFVADRLAGVIQAIDPSR